MQGAHLWRRLGIGAGLSLLHGDRVLPWWACKLDRRIARRVVPPQIRCRSCQVWEVVPRGEVSPTIGTHGGLFEPRVDTLLMEEMLARELVNSVSFLRSNQANRADVVFVL